MSETSEPSAPGWRPLALLLSLSWLSLCGTWLLPTFDLNGGLAWAATWVTELGGVYGGPVVTLTVAGIYLTRSELPAARRPREAAVLIGALFVVQGLVALANEFVIKPTFHRPRPNVLELESDGRLGMSAEEFYALGDRSVRREHLTTVLADAPPAVQRHWVRETGYSFPSGHALASMTLASCFATLAFFTVAGPRRYLLLALLPWAIAVCYTRPLLRVHAPIDVVAGGGLGVVAGLCAAWITRRFAPREVA